MTIKQSRLAIAAVFAAALAIPIMGNAQEDAGSGWLQVRKVSLQADGAAKWVELQKQLVAAERDDENASRDVWQVIRGGLDSFHIVSLHDNLAGFDEQGEGGALGDAQADWVAAITPTIASRTQTLSRRYADLSIPAAEDATRNLLMLRYTRVRSGQNAAYQSWVKDKLSPALAKGGATGVNFSRVAYGGNTGTWASASPVENWAALDGPGPLAGLSDAEREALFADYDKLVAGTEVRILRYREDLSY